MLRIIMDLKYTPEEPHMLQFGVWKYCFQNTLLLPSDKYDLNQLMATPVILYS